MTRVDPSFACSLSSGGVFEVDRESGPGTDEPL